MKVRAGFALAISFTLACSRAPSVTVGSKNFTESVILGELLAQRLERAGCRADRRLNLGGTFVCDRAIRSGSLDAYVEYSGTALTAILRQPAIESRDASRAVLEREYAKAGLRWGPNLGFNDTFAMIVRRDSGLRTISDLKRVQGTYRPAFGYEFTERPDGWRGLLQRYGLQFTIPPRTMDLGLTYKAVASGQADLIAGNSTDGLIESLGLVVLDDDQHYFPAYDAAIVYRPSIDRRCSAALESLANAIDDATMRRLNYEVDGRHRSAPDVVREFLQR